MISTTVNELLNSWICGSEPMKGLGLSIVHPDGTQKFINIVDWMYDKTTDSHHLITARNGATVVRGSTLCTHIDAAQASTHTYSGMPIGLVHWRAIEQQVSQHRHFH